MYATLVNVGIRELRENLRAVIDRAKGGEEIIITERGRPVAKLARVLAEDPLERGILEGRVRPALRPKEPVDLDALPRLRGKGKTLSDYVIEGR